MRVRRAVTNKGTRFTIDLEVDGAELYVKRVWPDVIRSVDLEGLLGGGYYWSDYVAKDNGYRVSGDDEEFGFRAGLGLNWRIANCLDLFMQASYRRLEFEDYEHTGHPVRFVSPGNPQAEADFSGFNVCGGIVWYF